MPNKKIVSVWYAVALLAAVTLFAGSAVLVSAQEGATHGGPTTRELPIKHAPGTKLTEQEIRGAGIFTQRCALCHLPKTFGEGGAKFCCMPSVESSLIGDHLINKNITPEQEAIFKRIIMNGGPTLMPGFLKYGL